MRLWLAVPLLVSVAVLVAPATVAQQFVAIEADFVSPPAEVPLGDSVDATLVVRNPSNVPGQPGEVNLAVGPIPDGWSITVSPNRFSLDSQEEKEVRVTVSATEQANDLQAQVVITAGIDYRQGNDIPILGDQARANDTATMNIRATETLSQQVGNVLSGWGAYVAVAAIVVLGAVAAAVALGRSRLRVTTRDVRLAAPPGSTLTVPVLLQNPGGRKQDVTLGASTSHGWKTGWEMEACSLSGRDERTVDLYIHVPQDSSGKEHVAVAVEGTRTQAKLDLVVEVET